MQMNFKDIKNIIVFRKNQIIAKKGEMFIACCKKEKKTPFDKRER